MLAHIRIALISNYILLLHLASFSTQAKKTDGFQSHFHKDDKVRDQKSREVLKYMNLSANPCFDFYEFTCGNWGKHHTIAKQNETITPDSIARLTIENNLLSILNEPVKVEDSPNDNKIKRFFKSCLTAERNSGSQQSVFSEFVQRNGGFPAIPGSNNWLEQNPTYDWQKIIAELHNKYGMDILVGIEVEAKNTKQENSIYLGEPRTTIIPPELCKALPTKNMDMVSVEHEVAENLKIWLTLNMHEARRVAGDIVSFEYDLCSGGHLGNGSEQYEHRTLGDFESQFKSAIHFGQIVSTSFGKPIYKRVYMKSKAYFEQLIKTVEARNTTTIANYIMYQAFSTLSIPPTGPQLKRGNYCLSVLKRYFSSVLSDIYWRRYIAPNIQTKDDIEDVYHNVKDTMKASLKNHWIADLSKRTGERKLDEIILDLKAYASEPTLDWFQIDEKNYWKNLMQAMSVLRLRQYDLFYTENAVSDIIEAYDIRLLYRPKIKRMDVGGGLQQEPFYHFEYPQAMRYALLGQKIARELMSAVDDLSWTTDFLGIPNWDSHTAQGYRDRMECFRQHISNYLYNKPNTFQNVTRLRELIANASGLNVAFNAYLLWLNFKNPNNDFTLLSKETLPELNFSNTQLFFITYAQQHCRTETANAQEQSQPMLSLLQRHSLERYEVNGALQNSVEFALEFGCALGTQMNPPDKCVIY